MALKGACASVEQVVKVIFDRSACRVEEVVADFLLL